MDELHSFCARVLGGGEASAEAERTARRAGHGDPVEALAAAAAACRSLEDRRGAHPDADGAGESGTHSGDATPLAGAVASPLTRAVAGELTRATARLPERHREALALRELLGRGYAEVARVVGIEEVAVALLLAQARVELRVALRGEGEPVPECPERERALRTIARRQDDEPVLEADEDWLVEHLGPCAGCGRIHAAMLEASACYRAWKP